MELELESEFEKEKQKESIGLSTLSASPTSVASVTTPRVFKYHEPGVDKPYICLLHKGQTHLDMKRIIQSSNGINYVISEVLYKIDSGYMYKGFVQNTGEAVVLKQAIVHKYKSLLSPTLTSTSSSALTLTSTPTPNSNSIKNTMSKPAPTPKPVVSSPWNESRLFNLMNSRGQHPNIVRFIDSMDVEDDIFADVKRKPEYLKCHYIVAEFSNKQTMFELISENYAQGLNEQDAKFYFRQLIQGLMRLHEAGIAHLDIKLENLLLTKQDTLKITDFGLSQIVTDPIPENECTNPKIPWPTSDIDKHGSMGRPIDTTSTFFRTSAGGMSRSASFTPATTTATFTSKPVSDSSMSTNMDVSDSDSTSISTSTVTSTDKVPVLVLEDEQKQKHVKKRIVKRLHGPYGSIMYVSPEVWDSISSYIANEQRGAWEEEVEIETFDPFLADVWSCGVVLSIIAFGNPLFSEPARTNKAYMMVINGDLCKLLRLWKYKCSDLLLDLLNKMLTVENKRISLYEVLQHPWCKGL